MDVGYFHEIPRGHPERILDIGSAVGTGILIGKHRKKKVRKPIVTRKSVGKDLNYYITGRLKRKASGGVAAMLGE